MRTNPDYADHPRTTIFPWDLGQGDTDAVLKYADRRGLKASFRMFLDNGLSALDVGGRTVGYTHAQKLTFIRWPSVIEQIDIAAVCHEQADASADPAKCYFIGATEGLIKIGYSIDPVSRLKNMQTGCPVDLAILAVANGGSLRESAYHMQFAEHRVRGEWFERHPDILAEIERINAEVRA